VTVSATVRPTRRELIRTIATAGGLAAAATLLNGCGAAQTATSGTSGTSPVPSHTGAFIMIIRHGEKPATSGLPQGIDADGKPDVHSLTPSGWTRAGALSGLFAPANGRLHPGLARPTGIYAAGGNGGEGLRTRETVTPLAARLGLPVNTQFSKGEETELADELVRRSEPTLVCWQHGELPAIAAALQDVTPRPPLLWPDGRFDLVWTLSPAGAGWSFHQIPELLLPDDSNQSIA
jgi:hypothetical protein